MRRLVTVVAVLAAAFVGGGVAMADGLGDPADPAPPTAAPAPASSTAAAAPAAETTQSVDVSEPGPSKMEAGLFVGGFISNFYHQFYDTSSAAKSGKIQPLNSVAPQFGLRYAVFPHRNFGIEGEGSVTLESTEAMGDSVTIYRLGAQAILQYPMRFTPFVGVGFGMWHSTSDALGDSTHFPLHAGVGARFYATPSIALRADVRFYRGPSYQDPFTLNASYGEFNVGMSWVPGATPAAAHHEDLDPDHDGVIGAADLCPNEYGTNPDGCPTRDKDGDGIPDAKDKCPDQPETINGYQDEDGCPDTIPDTDGDGINDLVDKCKTEPEDKDGFQDADGCPDPDNDNDGVTDARDKCPNVAGPVENDGCPDSDKDGDGVVDRLDNCPDVAGDPANHGCPKKDKQLVEITRDQIKILDTVRFQTGTAKLSAASNALLDNIARVMLAHLEIWKVRVEGHTDNVGKPEKNQKLSQDRADAVVDYLVKKGHVAPERLEAVGHGQDVPIGDNKTEKGRAQNRRVEFNIMRQEPAATNTGVPAPPPLQRQD